MLEPLKHARNPIQLLAVLSGYPRLETGIVFESVTSARAASAELKQLGLTPLLVELPAESAQLVVRLGELRRARHVLERHLERQFDV